MQSPARANLIFLAPATLVLHGTCELTRDRFATNRVLIAEASVTGESVNRLPRRVAASNSGDTGVLISRETGLQLILGRNAAGDTKGIAGDGDVPGGRVDWQVRRSREPPTSQSTPASRGKMMGDEQLVQGQSESIGRADQSLRGPSLGRLEWLEPNPSVVRSNRPPLLEG